MKRKIVIILCTLLFCLTGCDIGQNGMYISSEGLYPNIKSLSSEGIFNNYFYVVDYNTKVVYIQFTGNNRAGITVALNADGTPITEDQLEIKDKIYP